MNKTLIAIITLAFTGCGGGSKDIPSPVSSSTAVDITTDVADVKNEAPDEKVSQFILAASSEITKETWTKVALEGESVTLQSDTIVRYGAPEHWITKVVNGKFACDNQTFGDPIVGTYKRCEKSSLPAVTWSFIAKENAMFDLADYKTIRYGADKTWIEKALKGHIECSNTYFSKDPIPNTLKTCEVSSFSPVIWTKIADENKSFNLDKNTTVRYGIKDTWIEKIVSGKVECTNTFFGRDPAYGIVKQCDTSSIAPVDTPSTEPPTTPPTMPDMGNMIYIDKTKIPAGNPGSDKEQTYPTDEIAPVSDIGAFRTFCEFSHMAFDDPIVYPGQPGMSHLHSFFGNTGTNAKSTASSLANSGNSTCRGGILNRSAYWIPSMIDTKDGTPLKPVGANIYYKTGYNGILPKDVKPFPQGLRMIAGDPKNTQPSGSYRYSCIGDNINFSGQQIQNCPVGSQLWASISFPQCWDGINLDAPDHKSHMSYVVQDQSAPFAKHCPTSHPVAVPEITYNIMFDVTEKDSPLRWRLASDMYDSKLPGGYSLHADWFNGWRADIMDTFVRKCDNESRDCHSHLLGDGRAIY